MDVLGGVVARLIGTPHVLGERSSGENYSSRGWKTQLRLAIGKNAKIIIANSEGGLEYWRAHGAKVSFQVVRNALTPPRLEPAPLSRFGLVGRRILVAAGRLDKIKNVSVLVQVMAASLAKLPAHHAVIFGEGPERDAALALINKSGVGQRLHLGGYTDNLDGWLRAADVFVSASFAEGHPNVVIEAAAAGCPLVLSDIGAHREFAVGNSALFAPAQDVKRLAEAVIQSVLDRPAALIRADKARLLTQPLSIEAAAQEYVRIYRSLLNQGSLL
jgi:glycosyltransferase involved in cell wall biosynthesis